MLTLIIMDSIVFAFGAGLKQMVLQFFVWTVDTEDRNWLKWWECSEDAEEQCLERCNRPGRFRTVTEEAELDIAAKTEHGTMGLNLGTAEDQQYE